MIIKSGETYLAAESLQLDSLTIEEGASIAAPEGKYFLMTVDGVNLDAVPGTYTGDVRITVCDNFTRESLRFGEKTVSNFRAGAIIDNGKLVAESSVPAMFIGGTVTEKGAKDFRMESRQWDVNGFYITGDTEYQIDNAVIEMDGDGTDDFVGMGASIATAGNARLTVNNTKISNKGIGRGTLFAGEESQVTLNDCEFTAYAAEPTPEELAAGKAAERMMEPPWAIGLKGNVRTLNLAGSSTLTLNRCKMKCNRWGVLSVDGAHLNRMYVNDSTVEISGDNGYGFFCIADDLMFDYNSYPEPGCINVASNSTFNVAYTAALMSLGNGTAEFKNNSVVNSRRFGVFCHRHNGGELKVNSGAAFNTEKSCFVVKGSTLHIDLDNAKLNPKNGTILQLMDNDDVGMCDDPFLVPVGEVDVRDDRDLTVPVEGEDIFVNIANMETAGNFFNSTTNLMACNRRKTPGPGMPPPPPGAEPPAGMMPPPGMEPPAGMAPPAGENLNTGAPPMPEGAFELRGFMGTALMGAKNMEVKLSNATVTGMISAAAAAYGEGITEIDHDHCDELSNITQTPAAPVNNGVIVSVDAKSTWNVTGTSYITKLTLAEGGSINGAKMYVDDVETAIVPGVYTGIIELRA